VLIKKKRKKKRESWIIIECSFIIIKIKVVLFKMDLYLGIRWMHKLWE